MVWDHLESSSDIDGWLYFHLHLYPSMKTESDRLAIAEWETVFLNGRSLSVNVSDFQVELVKDGDAVAGMSRSFYLRP
jgi:hypothetical protein